MTIPKKFNPFTSDFDFFQQNESKTVVVHSSGDILKAIDDIQQENSAGTILLRSNIYLDSDIQLNLDGINLDLNLYTIFQNGKKLIIKGTNWIVKNGYVKFDNLAYNDILHSNNLGIEIWGDAVDINHSSSMIVNGLFDTITFWNYVGVDNDGGTNIKCSGSSGSWGRLFFNNCFTMSFTGHENTGYEPSITQKPLIVEVQETEGTSISAYGYRSLSHQSGDYSRAMLIKTATNSNGVQFYSDGNVFLANNTIVVNPTTKPTNGAVGATIIGTASQMTLRPELATINDLVGALFMVAAPDGGLYNAKINVLKEYITKYAKCKILIFENEYDNGDFGANGAIDWTLGQNQKAKLLQTCSISLPSVTGTARLQLKIIQNEVGGHSINFTDQTVVNPSNFDFASGTANQECIITFYFDGAKYIILSTPYYS